MFDPFYCQRIQTLESPKSDRIHRLNLDEMTHPDKKLALITNPPQEKCCMVLIEVFGCTLKKTHVFQWDTCNQLCFMIFLQQNRPKEKTNRVAALSLFCPILSPILSLITSLKMSLSSRLWIIPDSVISPLSTALQQSPPPSLRSSPSILSLSVINSCDAAQQTLSEWYTSTEANKPNYPHSAGEICIDDSQREEERDEKKSNNFFFLHHHNFLDLN